MKDDKILFVDDEENILHAYKLSLRKKFKVVTANSGPEGLEKLEAEGPFAVIVSDMKMPGMDGIEVLSRAADIAPDTVRMMLTGFAELQTAVEAVNSGKIFRFLTKPCPADEIAAERELLEDTLNGSIKVLTEILSLVNPATFGRAQRVEEIVLHLAAKLKLDDVWQYEIAAMLSQIGCITLDQSTLEKIYAGRELDEDEQAMVDRHPGIGRQLIEHIPRLEAVAGMVEKQSMRYADFGEPTPIGEMTCEDLGAQILNVAVNFDRLTTGGSTAEQAMAAMSLKKKLYNQDVVSALRDIDDQFAAMNIKEVMVRDMKLDMIVNDDVKACNGMLLVTKGQPVTRAVLERLKQYADNSIGVEEPVCVLVPKYADEPALV